jgi:hypothetical protein
LEDPNLGDGVYVELGDICIESEIIGFADDGIIIGIDDIAENLIANTGAALTEAEYQGRKVQLGKPTKGDVKKSKVYVKKPNGKVVKVNFGDKKLSIKKHIPGRRKNFRARHNCDNPGPRHKARYWSCRAW